MTGQGQGRTQFGAAEITAEVRAVNNRHLKIHLRTSDSIGSLEPQIEALVRAQLRRGSLQLGVQVSGMETGGDYEIQASVLERYYRQCQAISEKLGVDSSVAIGDLIALPGVVKEPRSAGSQNAVPDDVASAVLETVKDALECLNRMRAAEGESMRAELSRQLEKLEAVTTEIEDRAPVVIEDYRNRLTNKLASALAEAQESIQKSDITREVLLMADKVDIREEIVRLRSHFEQFRNLLSASESQGRKLDFLIQELFRESNTIGSKAGDALVAQRVVDVKTIIEQMRELVQNVE